MSTIFQAIPGKPYIPTYREIMSLAIKNMSDYLSHIGSHKVFDIRVVLECIKTNEIIEIDPDDKMLTNKEFRAIFYIQDMPGGTDCHYYQYCPIDKVGWEDELRNNLNSRKYKSVIRESMSIGYYWHFRRSAGQPAPVVLLYGMLAASLASLTDGIVHSDDGAWDYSMMPASTDEFLSFFLKPEHISGSRDKDYFQGIIDNLKNMGES